MKSMRWMAACCAGWGNKADKRIYKTGECINKMKCRKKKSVSAVTAAVCLLAAIQGIMPETYRGYVKTVRAASPEELIVEEEVQNLPESGVPFGGADIGGTDTFGGADVKRTDTQAREADIVIEQIEYSQTQPDGLTGGVNGQTGNAMPNGVVQQTESNSASGVGNGSSDGTAQGETAVGSGTGIQGGSGAGVQGGMQPDTGAQSEGITEPGIGLPEESEAESDTGSQGESETESDTGSAEESETEPNTGMTEESETESDAGTLTESESDSEKQSESGTQEQAAYIGIDNRHRYAGMKQSFSEGYQPKIKKNTLYLAVPFTSSEKLRGDCLTVDLAFAQDKNSPFVFKNYQKDIARRWYILQDGVMQEDADQSGEIYTGQSADAKGQSGMESGQNLEQQNPNRKQAYLYTCEIPLQPTAAPGQYSVTVKAWGYTEKGEKLTLEYQIFVRIPEPPADESDDASGAGDGVSGGGGGFSGGGGEETEEIIRQPKMLLEECSLMDKGLEAGVQETMRVSFRNRSASQTMYNLKVVLQTESEDIRMGRNSFYFSEVAPGDTIELENELSVTPLAEEGSASINFQFEYEDKKGTAESGTESITVPIVQPVQVELETGQMPSSVYASDTAEFSFNARNLSRTGVYNVRIRLEGDGMFPTEDIFIGNMEAGTQGSAVMRVYVGTRTMKAIGDDPGEQDSEKYGPVSGTITMQYEDALGKTHEVSQTYQTEIKKAEILSLKVDKEPEQNSWWISVFAALVAGLLLLVAVLIWRLRRKNILLEEARKTEKVML